ncbi:MAG: hypothetical protein M0024_12350 [Nitrospiraceae bacterium]|nr:hypothetical protein [Nitrospiraceae bacterium]
MSTLRKLFLLAVFAAAALACFVPAASAGAAAGAYPAHITGAFGQRPDTAVTFGQTDSRVLKVISLLEKKTDDPKVIGRLRSKISALGEKRLQMVSSLSDRILSKEHTAESDVAFLLVTALIVFS